MEAFARQDQEQVEAPFLSDDEPRVLGITSYGWISLAIGLAAAAAASAVGILTYVFSFFVIVVHEMGHAISGWIFGYPSIPSFDFFYGGGVTLHQNKLIFINVFVIAALVLAAVLFRRNSAILIGSAVAAVLYPVLAFTVWNEALIIALGHGTELIIAGIFLYRAISGRSIIQTAERPVYAFLGFFIVIYNVVFNYKLIADTTFRFEYEYAKDGMQMDLTRLAGEYLSTSLVGMAKIFLILSLAVPFISLAVHLVRFHRDSTSP